MIEKKQLYEALRTFHNKGIFHLIGSHFLLNEKEAKKWLFFNYVKPLQKEEAKNNTNKTKKILEDGHK